MSLAWDFVLSKGASLIVNKKPPRNLEEPRGKWKPRVVRCATPMDPEEELLIEVLGAIFRKRSSVEEPVGTILVPSE
jgi:hypothetical protein